MSGLSGFPTRGYGEPDYVPNPEPSEVAETTAGEREGWSCYLYGSTSAHVHGPDTDTMSSAPAEPDAGEVEALAAHLYDVTGFHAADSWATETSINRGRYEALAEAVLASPWLAAHVSAAETKARAEALREAADDVETALLAEMVPERVLQADVVHYLRRRAASIARGDAR